MNKFSDDIIIVLIATSTVIVVDVDVVVVLERMRNGAEARGRMSYRGWKLKPLFQQ